jgi:catechol 2,3-dioxygenase-like lactoylglutathione lyase family enzyme
MANSDIRLEHVGFRVSEEAYEATLRFYEDQLGWQKVRELAPPRRVAFVSDGQVMLEVVAGEASPITGGAHLAFVVSPDAFSSTCDRLRASGVSLDPVSRSSDGSDYTFFSDPAGNRCQLVGRVAG